MGYHLGEVCFRISCLQKTCSRAVSSSFSTLFRPEFAWDVKAGLADLNPGGVPARVSSFDCSLATQVMKTIYALLIGIDDYPSPDP